MSYVAARPDGTIVDGPRMYTPAGSMAVAAVSMDPRDVALRRAFDRQAKARNLSSTEISVGIGYTAVEVTAAIESQLRNERGAT